MMARRVGDKEGASGDRGSGRGSGGGAGDARGPAGDPTRALELLWGVREARRRGPKPALTLERIVEAAVEIADNEGFEALSMRNVAARLGVAVASLYTYVPGKSELLALMLDAAVATERLPHERPGSWRDKMEGWAREDWETYRTHPWALQLASIRPLPGPNLLRWLDSALTVLADGGLTEGEMFAAVQSVDAYVRGHARMALAEGRPGAGPAGAVDERRAAQRRFLETHVDLSDLPALGRVSAAGGFWSAEDVFEFGLARLLDGIEALTRARAR